MPRLPISGYVLILASLISTSACTSTQTASRQNLVEQAYNTSGVIQVPPYTRTIFSTIDF